MKRAAQFLSLGVVLLGAAWHAHGYWPFLSDDALISLRYAQRLLDGHGLTWTDGERVEGYTDLAWVLLTALLGALRVDLVVAARALGLLGGAAAIVFTSLSTDRPLALSLPRTLTGGLMLALSGPLAVWSIGGLEHGFEAGVLAAAAWLVMRERAGAEAPRPARRALAGLLVLLALLRADGAVLIGGLLLGNVLRFASRAAIKRSFLMGLAPLAALLLQLAFRRLYYGAWVPNTALVKVGLSQARLELGLEHVRLWAESGLMLLVAAAVALAFQLGRERRWVVPLTTSIAWVAYLIVMGGDIFPAWRQLLFGIVPLGLLIAEGGEAAWDRARFDRAWLRAGARVALLAGWTALAITYARAQARDPQNQRGVEERWEFDGVSLGGLLRQALSQQRPLLAVDAAGALPYFSQLPSLDLLGLNDRYIATHPPPGLALSTGHELGDGAYVWSRKPDILSMCGAGGGRAACFLSGKQVLAHPDFGRLYQLIRYRSVIGKELTGELWIRREEGPLGVERSADRLVVPGWLLPQASGVAELHEGRLQALVTPLAPAHLVALRVPAGRWKVAAQNVSVGVLCEGRGVPRGQGDGLVIELPAEGHLDLLVGSTAPVFVDQVVFTRTDDAPQVRCDPPQGVLEVDATQLLGSAVPGAYFLQPHGLKLSRGLARIRLGPAHPERSSRAESRDYVGRVGEPSTSLAGLAGMSFWRPFGPSEVEGSFANPRHPARRRSLDSARDERGLIPINPLGQNGATRYELSVDGNDTYRLRFLAAGGEVLGERSLPDQPAGGLVVQTIDVPAATEVVEVLVSGGDGLASIGHLVPLP